MFGWFVLPRCPWQTVFSKMAARFPPPTPTLFFNVVWMLLPLSGVVSVPALESGVPVVTAKVMLRNVRGWVIKSFLPIL